MPASIVNPVPSELRGTVIIYRPKYHSRYTQATVVHVTPVKTIADGKIRHLAHLDNSEQVILEECFLPILR